MAFFLRALREKVVYMLKNIEFRLLPLVFFDFFPKIALVTAVQGFFSSKMFNPLELFILLQGKLT